MMTTYRITKFNPAKRNEAGHYLDQAEWTSVSDIGKPGYRNLTFEAYEKVENAYVQAVMCIMQDNGISSLMVDSLEWYGIQQEKDNKQLAEKLRNITVDIDRDIANLKNGDMVQPAQINTIMRLILRELVWMRLVHERMEVRFGYDYYMYVTTQQIRPSTIEQIEASGLFVEPLDE